MKRVSAAKLQEEFGDDDEQEDNPDIVADHDWIDQTFGDTGPFAKEFPGYQPREGQIDFAHAVEDTIADKSILLAQAGCGVGKSVSYLTPIIRSIQRYGGTAVIATASINLQEQLINKDIPLLHKLMSGDGNFTYAIAKGFSNYLCSWQLDVNDTRMVMGDKNLKLDMFEKGILSKIRSWQTTTGDISEFETDIGAMPGIKRLVTIPSDECIKKKCEYFYGQGGKICFPRAARRKFASVNIIVTNYHMYFLDMELRRLGVRGGILPEHRILVWDEAHSAPSIARNNFGLKVSQGSVKAAIDALDAKGERANRLGLPRDIDRPLMGQTEQAAENFFNQILKIRNNPSLYKARIDREKMIDGEQLETLLKKVAKKYTDVATQESTVPEAKEWLRTRSALCTKQAGVISGARVLDDAEYIYYIEKQTMSSGHERATLVREPLFPSKILRESLFEKDENPRSIICCSATLTTTSKTNPFAYSAGQLGVRKHGICIAESPFDFRKTVFVVPKVPVPETGEPWRNAVNEKLIETVQAARGRTLGLFTSYESLKRAKLALEAAKLPYKILVQGQGGAPRSELIKQFKADEESVLLGTDSFWTGIDVPGPSLLALFIDKLPFDGPDDPVLDAIKEAYPKDWFKSFYIPRMLMKMLQGFGRLVRSVDDRGAVVVCDRRIMKKGYGTMLKNSLPEGVKITENMEAVARFCWPEG